MKKPEASPAKTTEVASALRAKNESLESAQRLANVGSWDFNLVTYGGSWSRQMYIIFDRDPSLGEPPFEEFLGYLHPEDRAKVIEYQQRAISTGKRFTFRLRSNPERGPVKHLVSTIQRRPDEPDIVQGSILDETERIVAAATRDRLHEEERRRRTLESLAVLSAGLAHDFNNALTAIASSSEFLRQHVDNDELVRSALDDIDDACTDAAKLCKSMLAYAGERALTTRVIAIGDLAQDVKATVDPKHTIEIDVPSALSKIDGDPTMLRQLMRAVIDNALEASKPADRITIAAGQTADDGALRVWVEVRDSGVGMVEAVRARALEPFFSTKFRGRGLGLAAALGIVSSHGGSIDIQSEPDRGTTVRLEFPASIGRPAAGVVPVRERETTGWRVLIVDDEALVRRSLKRHLVQNGYDVGTAVDAAAALDWLGQHTPDVILLDVTMPGVDGLETLRRLRKRGTTAPVILMSGFHGYKDLGGHGDDVLFLEKPFTAGALLELLSTILDDAG